MSLEWCYSEMNEDGQLNVFKHCIIHIIFDNSACKFFIIHVNEDHLLQLVIPLKDSNYIASPGTNYSEMAIFIEHKIYFCINL